MEKRNWCFTALSIWRLDNHSSHLESALYVGVTLPCGIPSTTFLPYAGDVNAMTNRYVQTAKRILGQTSPGRYFEVFEDDAFIVSFPKSGNTWTRFLIANLLHPEQPADFSNIDRLIPESEGLTRNELNRVPRPRIMKSHEYFDPRFRKVIYIVRDPRDVAVSQFQYYRKRRRIADDYPIEKFVSDSWRATP